MLAAAAGVEFSVSIFKCSKKHAGVFNDATRGRRDLFVPQHLLVDGSTQ